MAATGATTDPDRRLSMMISMVLLCLVAITKGVALDTADTTTVLVATAMVAMTDSDVVMVAATITKPPGVETMIINAASSTVARASE